MVVDCEARVNTDDSLLRVASDEGGVTVLAGSMALLAAGSYIQSHFVLSAGRNAGVGVGALGGGLIRNQGIRVVIGVPSGTSTQFGNSVRVVDGVVYSKVEQNRLLTD